MNNKPGESATRFPSLFASGADSNWGNIKVSWLICHDILSLLDESAEQLKAGATSSIEGYPDSVKRALTPSPGSLSAEDERAFKHIEDAVTYTDGLTSRAIEEVALALAHLRSRLSKPAPPKGEEDGPTERCAGCGRQAADDPTFPCRFPDEYCRRCWKDYKDSLAEGSPKAEPPTETQCPACEGHGVEPFGDYAQCPKCRGTGMKPAPPAGEEEAVLSLLEDSYENDEAVSPDLLARIRALISAKPVTVTEEDK